MRVLNKRTPSRLLGAPHAYLPTMRLANYDALLNWAEEAATRSPAQYRTWVGFFAGLGYLVVGSTLFLGLILLAVAVAICVMAITSDHIHEGVFKLAAITGVFGGGLTFSVIKGLMGGFPPAEGMPLTRAEAPGLFDEVERLRRALGVPPVHRIVLTNEFNAALYQRPRLGLFGWYQNTLILGLPLLRQFNVDQARAVIAHELGHLRGEHGRFGAKIHRLRVIWARIVERNNSKLLGGFLRWYAPRFNAYSFVMARMHEREADHVSAELCSPSAAGSALIRSEVVGRLYGRFWEQLTIVAAREPEAPTDVFSRLDRHLATPPPEARRWLGEALKRGNSREDPHPCLRERLDLIGYVRIGNVPPAPTPGGSAADAWLENATSFASRADTVWRETNAEAWRAQHTKGAELLARRDALATRSASFDVSRGAGNGAGNGAGHQLSLAERWELASLVHHFDGPQVARSPLMVVVALAPDHAPALFQLGADLLDEGDARGIALVEAAMFHDQDAIAVGANVLRHFADAQGQRQLVEQAENLNEARREQEELAAAERSKKPAAGNLRAHGLDDAQLASLRAALARHADIASADVVQVALKHLPERRHFLVVVRIHVAWWKPRSADADTKLLQVVTQEFELPGSWLIISASGTDARLAKAAARIDGARIFSKTST